MNDLYMTEPHSEVFLKEGNLRILINEEVRDIPLEQLNSVILTQGTKVTGPLLKELNEASIPVTFLDWKEHCLARVEPFISKNGLLRRKQIEMAICSEKSLTLAKVFIRGKIRNQRIWLLRWFRRKEDDSLDSHLEKNINEIKLLEHRVITALELNELRGIEGLAAKIYFSFFNEILKNTDFSWNGRNRHPPKDPINALLSFGYSLLLSDVLSACHIVGLDPYVGFLHEERSGRPELALDLMEELRTPYVDSFVFGLIQRNVLTLDDFIIEKEPVLKVEIKHESKKLFLLKWKEYKERKVQHPFLKTEHSWGHFPILQARLLARFFHGSLEHYYPFIWR